MRFTVDKGDLDKLIEQVGSVGDAEEKILAGAAAEVGEVFGSHDVPHRSGELEGSKFTRIVGGKIIESGFTSRHMSRAGQRRQVLPRPRLLADGAEVGAAKVLGDLVGKL